jgi:hypothetical protein
MRDDKRWVDLTRSNSIQKRLSIALNVRLELPRPRYETTPKLKHLWEDFPARLQVGPKIAIKHPEADRIYCSL